MRPRRRRHHPNPDAAPRAISRASLAPLSREQKTHLVLLMRNAWEKHGGGEDFETWRVAHSLRACGRRLSTARNADFLPLRAHFRNLLGQSGMAFADLMRSQDEPRLAALHRMQIECRRAADVLPNAEAYITGMLHNRGITLQDASPNQIRHATFTLRRKAQLERKKHQARQAATEHVDCPF